VPAVVAVWALKMTDLDALTPVQRAYKQGYRDARGSWGYGGLMLGLLIGGVVTFISIPYMAEAVVRCLTR
jgi:hypothetical protein